MRASSRNRRTVTAITIVLVTTAVSFSAERFLSLIRVAENWSRDLRTATLTPPEPQSDKIVVVAINEDTLTAFAYRSPLDRLYLSQLLRSLERKGAKLIGLDILLDQPSEEAKDGALRQTMRDLSIPLVVASPQAVEGITPRQAAFASAYLANLHAGVPAVVKDPFDGVVRAVVLNSGLSNRPRPGFVTVLARELDRSVPDVEVVDLRYRGRPDARTTPFAVYPAHSVPLLPDDWIRDRIVLVGADLTFTDRHRTPFSVLAGPGIGDMPGVLIQAHALSQLLEGKQSPQLAAWKNSLVIVLFAAIGVAIGMAATRPAVIFISIVGTCVIVWIGGFITFRYAGALVSLMSPTVALTLAAGLTYAWRWRQEQAERRFIQSAFSKFVAPAVVDQLIADPQRLKLGGERRETTFLFTDIADYTTLTETTDPTQLVGVMGEYFNGTCEIVIRHEGTIEKIVGDALHVMFNAPLEQPDHPRRAVACALALDAFCQTFVAEQHDRGISFGATRIGVNTGVTVVGNFGGEKFFDYSATGDAINATARLESANKYFGTRVCVSGATAARCPEQIFRPVGELVLKGKAESVTAYEPIAASDISHGDVEEYLAAYRLLSSGDSRAVTAFSELAARYPQDALVRFHRSRLEAGESGTLIVMKGK